KKAVISAYIAGPAPDHPAIHAPLGGVLVQGGYRVDVARIIDYFRQKWTMSNQLYNELNAVPYPLKDYSRIIDCTGPYQAINTELKGLPSRVSRGECLIFEADMALDAIINNGHWLLPLGNNRFKFGATYQWEDCFGIPQKSGYEFLSEKLETLIPRVPVRILAYEAGTRNIMCDTRAIVGPHPSDASRWVVGGVGSKGTQLLPFIAQHLVHVLESRAPLHPELDIRRFNRAET
ncbi:FAD-binding oxidoreductase, partial [bacterium]|nr:FAD-binding oxidoreductase [bacterium]